MADEKIPFHRERLQDDDAAIKHRVQQERFKRAMEISCAQVFGTPTGQRVLKFIADQCGYNVSKISGNAQIGLDVKDGTLYNAARETVYLSLRKYVPVEILKKAEFRTAEDDEFLL